MPKNRSYDLYIHIEAKPFKISINGQALKEWSLRPDKNLVKGGWYFDQELWQVHVFVEEDPVKQDFLRIDVLSDATERRKERVSGNIFDLRQAQWQDDLPDSSSDRRTTGASRSPKAIGSIWEHDLEISLVSGDLSQVYETLDSIWEDRLGIACNKNETREYLLYLSGTFVRIAERHGWRVKDVAGDDYKELLNLPEMTLSDGTYSLLCRVMQRFVDHLRTIPPSSINPLIGKVLAIVEEEIDQEISLQNIADRLHVNSSHLSRLFKKELGQSFSTYVMEKKMQLAKQMLLEGGRIVEVTMTLGYKDSSHFIRVFRNYWGVTPGELIDPIKKIKKIKRL
ncbi:HTH-type transcriptional regulator GadX [compost metagenome]